MTAEGSTSDRRALPRRAPWLRVALAAAFVFSFGSLAVRTAIVRAFAEEQPQTAALVWPDHPDVLKSLALAKIAQAAARAQEPPADLLVDVRRIAERAPLAPEPFLIEGSLASRAGDYPHAQTLLAAAVRRDPRSVAARYLLADLYMQRDLLGPALDQLSVLARLSPSFAQSLIPGLAQYAKEPGAAPQVARSIRNNPQLANQLLEALASDPRNAKLVLYLASGLPSAGDLQSWQAKLLSTLVQAGDYKNAYALWHSFDRSPGSTDEFAFREAARPSPFTWAFASGADGSAEPDGGSLRVTFSGNQTVILASRVAPLEPGKYTMRWKNSRPADGVAWKVTCLPANTPLLSQSLGSAATSASFTVTGDCKAQRFELTGEAQTVPSPAEFSIDEFQVKRVSGS